MRHSRRGPARSIALAAPRLQCVPRRTDDAEEKGTVGKTAALIKGGHCRLCIGLKGQRAPLDQGLPRRVMVTARFFWMKMPFSGSNADAVAETSALPPVNRSAARPWKSVVVV